MDKEKLERIERYLVACYFTAKELGLVPLYLILLECTFEYIERLDETVDLHGIYERIFRNGKDLQKMQGHV